MKKIVTLLAVLVLLVVGMQPVTEAATTCNEPEYATVTDSVKVKDYNLRLAMTVRICKTPKGKKIDTSYKDEFTKFIVEAGEKRFEGDYQYEVLEDRVEYQVNGTVYNHATKTVKSETSMGKLVKGQLSLESSTDLYGQVTTTTRKMKLDGAINASQTQNSGAKCSTGPGQQFDIPLQKYVKDKKTFAPKLRVLVKVCSYGSAKWFYVNPKTGEMEASILGFVDAGNRKFAGDIQVKIPKFRINGKEIQANRNANQILVAVNGNFFSNTTQTKGGGVTVEDPGGFVSQTFAVSSQSSYYASLVTKGPILFTAF